MPSADRWRALALLASTQFVLLLDTSIINVAAPSIGESLRISARGAVLGGQRLPRVLRRTAPAQRTSRRPARPAPRLPGRSGRAVRRLAAGRLRGRRGAAITARAVQGVGAAMAAAAAVALVLSLFPDGPERHRALGVFAAMAGAGGAVGTVLGGVLTSWLGWESTLALNVVAGVLPTLPVPRLLPGGAGSGRERGIDVPGAIAGTAGLALLAYAVVNAGEPAGGPPGPSPPGAPPSCCWSCSPWWSARSHTPWYRPPCCAGPPCAWPTSWRPCGRCRCSRCSSWSVSTSRRCSGTRRCSADSPCCRCAWSSSPWPRSRTG
ncbi:hypothetical protein SVIOM342S_01634 [Streptomyces violaceorubidus]